MIRIRCLRLTAVFLAALCLLAAPLLVAGAAGAQLQQEPARPSAASGHAPAADVNLIKDDGVRDGGFVLRDPGTNSEYHALFLNHFRAAEAGFPFQLEEIHYFAGTSNLQGEPIQLLVYGDADGGSPANATLRYTETVTVTTAAGNNVYVLSTPVAFISPTDILIGISTLYADGGVPWPNPRFPGSYDSDGPQGDSYLAWMATPTDPVNVANLAGFTNLIETALTGTPSNLMIRGFGSFVNGMPQITLNMTVGTDRALCAAADAIGVGAGAEVTYCYEVTNSGTVTFSNHALVDSALGSLLNNHAYVLGPGSSTFVTRTVTISAGTVSTATWTATEFGPVPGGRSASAGASATVLVVPNDPLSCNGGTIGFENGIPGDWQVVAAGASPQVLWTSIAFAGEGGNYTGGSGEAATASSVAQGGSSGGLYDTALRTNSFSLEGAGTPTLTYLANYQNFSGGDFLEVQVSVDGGGSWDTLLSWNEDHPVDGLHQAPGEMVTLDLTAYIGEPDVIVRWRYHDPVGPQTAQDWYAQIDDVALSCSSGPSIRVVTSVGTNPTVCATGSTLVVDPGTTVAYCYMVTNTGPLTLTRHDLVDDPLGSLLSGLAIDLAPGASVDTVAAGLRVTATIYAGVVNTATWTAYNPGPTDVATGSASATVLVNQPAPLSCNGPLDRLRPGHPAQLDRRRRGQQPAGGLDPHFRRR